MIIPGVILGILWTTASWNPDPNGPSIQITNTRRILLEKVNNYLKAEIGKVYAVRSFSELKHDKEYTFYRCNIYSPTLIYVLREEYLWRGRKENPRYYPAVFQYEKQEDGFLRYYIKSKSTIDKGGSRLRIYGNWNLIDSINIRLSEILGVGIKTPQNHSNSKTMKVLHYQSKREVLEIQKSFMLRGISGYLG